MAATQKAPSTKAVFVNLNLDAYEAIEKAAQANRRGRGAEVAYRIEKQLREGKD